jgi:DNA-binding transcriptional regulator YiaG
LTDTFVRATFRNVALDNPTSTSIGAEIRRVRDSMGMTLMEFGRHVGIPWQTVGAYEGDRTVPPADRLLQILHATRGAKRPFRVDYLARTVSRAASEPVARAA